MDTGIEMRIFLTEFEWDGVVHDGPNLVADTRDEAELLAEGNGLNIVGEVANIVLTEEGIETLH